MALRHSGLSPDQTGKNQFQPGRLFTFGPLLLLFFLCHLLISCLLLLLLHPFLHPRSLTCRLLAKQSIDYAGAYRLGY